jgi:hypothetical protein
VRLALIPPDSLAEMMTLTDLHLLLPEQLDRLPGDFIRSLKGYKILDNGIAEGMGTPINRLLQYIDDFLIDELVLPDIIQDCDETIASARTYAGLKSRFPTLKLMGVAQGKSMAEVLKCATALTYMDHVDVIGFPRWWLSAFGTTFRADFARSIVRDGDFPKQIHCLGGNPLWPDEPYALSQNPGIRSMDTSLPFVYGLHRQYLPSKHEIWRGAGYFQSEVFSDYQREVIEANVRLYIRWAQAPTG